MGLWRDENQLYPFQGDHIVQAYSKPTTLLGWDTGTGKSPGALALSCLALENGQADLVILVCEKNKLAAAEWPESIDRFTTIDWKLYHGAIAKRQKIRENLPQMILTTADTIKRDAAVFPKNRRIRSAPTPGPLIDALEGLKVTVIIDETSRISNRKSDTYKAMKLLIDSLRANGGCHVMAMTATPMERDPSSLFDLGRILIPELMPTVNDFEHQYVAAFDLFRLPMRYKNLSASDHKDPEVTPFSDLFKDILLRKRKSDPDVVNFFPKRREMPPTFVDLGKAHKQFYDVVTQISQDVPEFEQRQYVNVLRMIAGHPMSLCSSNGEVAKAIVDHVTPEGLRAMGSAKTDRMVAWCQEVVRDQGAQAVIFTFFAQTILPLLQEALESSGFSVSANHGGLSVPARSAAQRAFRAGETEIFLTSDAGAKGLNLPEATYLLHYERPSTHANLVQRSDRIHRIDSLAEAVFIYSLVSRDTIEEGLFNLNLRRNDWADRLLGDDEAEGIEFLSASDRKQLFKQGKAA